eukprot:8754619-Pyramimonas_sp.AAC.1
MHLTRKALSKTKLSMFSPNWSAPAEILRMVFMPSMVTHPNKFWTASRGLGLLPGVERLPAARQGREDPYNMFPLKHLEAFSVPKANMFKLLAHIRRVERIPVQAVLSQGFPIDKKNAKPGCAGCRLLHARCRLWRAFMGGRILRG